MEKIREITALDTFIVRHPVLRAGKPIESCHFEGDDLPTTKHFGIFHGQDLVGIISVYKNNLEKFAEEKQFQFRGMAVLSSQQGKRLGEKLLHFAEDYVRIQKGNLIWFNARNTAVRFYEKAGYTVKGNSFEIPDVGSHYIMYKPLT